MVADVLGQTGMLGQGKKLVQPSAIESRQGEKQHGKPTSHANGPPNHPRIDQEITTRPPEHLPPLALWHELSCLFAGTSQRMQEHHIKHVNGIRNPEKVEEDSRKV